MNYKELFEVESRLRSLLTGGLGGIKKDVIGLAFEELREYVPGDPLSSVHQGASFQHRREMVALRIPDRKIEIVFVIDTTASMRVGEMPSKKFDAASRLLAVGAEVAREHQSRLLLSHHVASTNSSYLVGQLIQSGTPGGVAKQFAKFAKQFFPGEQGEPFDLALSLEALVRRGKQQSLLIVVVSDFLISANYEDALRKLIADKHTVVGVATLDSAEIALPKLSFGAVRVRDSETGVSALIAGSPEHYLDVHKAIWANTSATFEVVQTEGESK